MNHAPEMDGYYQQSYQLRQLQSLAPAHGTAPIFKAHHYSHDF